MTNRSTAPPIDPAPPARPSTPSLAAALAVALAACGADGGPPVPIGSATGALTTAPRVVRREPAAGPPRLVELAPGATVDALVAELGRWYALRPDDELLPIGEVSGPGGLTYLRLQQHYRGMPVLGSQVIVAHHDGLVATVSGRFTPDLDVALTPVLAARDAERLVADLATAQLRARLTPPSPGTATTALSVLPGGPRPRLVYAVELPFPGVQTYAAQVDAITGEVILLDDGRREATGSVVHGHESVVNPPGLVTISISADPAGFLLKSEDGLVYTRNANNNNAPPAMSTDVTSATTLFPSSWPADAHYGANLAVDFLAKRLQRFGWDGAGTQLAVFGNVLWTNSGFIKGPNHLEIGNSSSSGPTNWGSVDLVGHEVGHAVTSSTVPGGGLIYQGESGALDESFADMLGAMVEAYGRAGQAKGGNWTVFEDVFPGGIRDMATPNNFGDPEAYNQAGQWKSTAIGANDSGGVHSNSGVGNKWFQLIADASAPGGTSNVNPFGTQYRVQPLGLEVAGQIAYRGLFNLASGSQYADARTATLAAASQLCTVAGPSQPLVLIDTQAYDSVWEAWRAVAVGAAGDLTPISATSPAANAMGINPADVELEFAADWDPADTYTIQIDTDPSFPAPLTFAAGPGDVTLDPVSGLYRVKRKLPNGMLTANQQYAWRVINDDVAALPVEHRAACARAPQAFATGQWQVALKAPIGIDQHPWDLSFEWETFPDILEYELELYASDDLNTQPEWTDTVSSPPYLLDVRMAATYFWRVRPISTAGEPGNWTALASFATAVPLGELAAPADGAALYPWGVTFDWKEVIGTETYRLELTDYPECFPPGAQVPIETIDVPGAKHAHTTSLETAWQEAHPHCWRVTPVGPELFKGKYPPEDGAISDVWQFTTQDLDTLPGSLAPLDRVGDPAFWAARTPHLLFPSTVSVNDVMFSWKGVSLAESYRVEYFPILGKSYSPTELYILVGALPYTPASPTIAGQEPPTTVAINPIVMASMYFTKEPDFLYGYWYRVIANGPDGSRSPSPPWLGVTSQSLFFGEDAYSVPAEYVLLAQQPQTPNNGVILLRPPPVTIASAVSDGNLYQGPDGTWPGWSLEAAATDGVSSLWAPWGRYHGVVFTGPGCAPDAIVTNHSPDQSAEWLPSKVSYAGAAPSLSMSVQVSEEYGDDAFGDPALYWNQTPFAGTPEATPFAQRSQCIDLVLPEPEDYGGTDGAPPEPPAEPIGACDAAVHQGGNAPESHTIELGTTSGTTTLYINTFEVADSINVYYENQLVAQSGCLGTSFTVSGCLSNGWCCNGVQCAIDLYFDGASSTMQVEVSPNCNGSGDTEWAFTLSCPL